MRGNIWGNVRGNFEAKFVRGKFHEPDGKFSCRENFVRENFREGKIFVGGNFHEGKHLGKREGKL